MRLSLEKSLKWSSNSTHAPIWVGSMSYVGWGGSEIHSKPIQSHMCPIPTIVTIVHFYAPTGYPCQLSLDFRLGD